MPKVRGTPNTSRVLRRNLKKWFRGHTPLFVGMASSNCGYLVVAVWIRSGFLDLQPWKFVRFGHVLKSGTPKKCVSFFIGKQVFSQKVQV